jgi:hypothetical protein
MSMQEKQEKHETEKIADAKRQHNVFVTCPAVRGMDPFTAWNIGDMRTELEKIGHRLHGSSLKRMPLDLARNEGVTVFLSTTCDINLLIDDDVQIEPAKGVLQMLAAINAGCDIVSAPCRMRSEGNLFNVIPVGAPVVLGNQRVVECAWTGLGAVMVTRRVFETMRASALARATTPACVTCGHKEHETYRSTLMPQYTSVALFKSRIDPARRFFVESPADENVYSLDDKAFSLRALEAGFKIHAAIDVATVHDGMRGCFSEELDKLEKARLREMQSRSGKQLLGPDGRKL